MKGFFVACVAFAASVAAFAPPPAARAGGRALVARNFFGQFMADPEADAALDKFVSSAKAVLLTDGGAGGEGVKALLKQAKLTKFTEVNLKSQPMGDKMIGSLKRRVKVGVPVLIVSGQVFDKSKIEYLVKQDMMLPVFRAAGTSGEVRLPFQDLRFYLSKTIQ